MFDCGVADTRASAEIARRSRPGASPSLLDGRRLVGIGGRSRTPDPGERRPYPRPSFAPPLPRVGRGNLDGPDLRLGRNTDGADLRLVENVLGLAHGA